MRIHFENVTRPKLVAKALRKSLKGLGLELSLSRCQEAVAAMFGYRDWHDLTNNHAASPASPDDTDCPAATAAGRRSQYGRVLVGLGVAPGDIGAVLDAVRPSDRSSGRRAARSGAMPRLAVEAYETDGDGNDLRSLGMQDLTETVVQAMVPSSGRHVREIESPPRVLTIQGGLSGEARRLGFEGRLALTGFGEALEEFIRQVGGREALPEFRKRLDEVSWQRVLVAEAERELAAVKAARFTADFSNQVMLHVTHGRDDYAQSPDEAYDYWEWDAYTASNPVPDWDEGEARKAWYATYDAWVAVHAPPFVFGTLPDPWRGIDPKDVREQLADDGEVDLPNLIDSSLSDHYDGAYEQVEDEEGLWAIVEEWLPHAGKGTREDKALEERLAAWNARQTIVTYNPDMGTVLPSREGRTHADAIAWCEWNLATLRMRLGELSLWQSPAAEPEMPDAPAA